MRVTLRATGPTSIATLQRRYLLASSAYWALGAVLSCLPCLPVAAATPSASSTAASTPEAAQVCAACHGAQGAGNATGIPRIGGMNADYLAHTLADFKTGKRPGETMQPIARTLSGADMASLAKYFAAQHPPLAPSPHPPSSDSVAAGKRMAIQGDNPGIPACFGCHAMNGKGHGEHYPSIAGEPSLYVINRLHAFQARARHGTPKPGTMTAVASKLTDTQIRNVAAYLSVMPLK